MDEEKIPLMNEDISRRRNNKQFESRILILILKMMWQRLHGTTPRTRLGRAELDAQPRLYTQLNDSLGLL